MSWITRLWQRKRLERELDKEVAFHLERQVQDLIAAGVAPAEARRQATLLLGGMEQTKEACRDARGTRWLEDFFGDCRYGMRMLRRSPAFTCAAVASLALGIGANTAIFSLVDLVVLRMMPVREPGRLVEFQKFHPTYGRGNISYPQFEQFQRELQSFDGVLAYSQARREIKIGGRPENVNVEMVSGSYYGVLGVPAIAGRTFGTETDRVAGGSPVAVITDSYWKKRFGSDPSAVGSSFQLNQTVFTIIGVTPPGFTGVVAGRIPDITVPIAMDGEVRGGRSWLKSPNFNWLSVMGRLRNGQSLAQARSEVKTIFARMAADDAARTDKATLKTAALAQRMELEPAGNGFDELRRRFSEPLGILMGVVALVLLIACANIANLLLAKAAARQREIAVRLAIGAGRGRVIRQLFTEGLLLSAIRRHAGRAAGILAGQRAGHDDVEWRPAHGAGGPAGSAGIGICVAGFAAGLSAVQPRPGDPGVASQLSTRAGRDSRRQVAPGQGLDRGAGGDLADAVDRGRPVRADADQHVLAGRRIRPARRADVLGEHGSCGLQRAAAARLGGTHHPGDPVTAGRDIRQRFVDAADQRGWMGRKPVRGRLHPCAGRRRHFLPERGGPALFPDPGHACVDGTRVR